MSQRSYPARRSDRPLKCSCTWRPSPVLSRLLAPLTFRDFATRVWGTTWLQTSKPGRAAWFAKLSSFDRITQGLAKGTIPPNHFNYFDGRSRPLKKRATSPQQAAFRVNRLDLLDARIARFAAEAARFSGCEVQANAYVSYRGREALDWHWDNHDVLVLQLEGEKRWSIFAKEIHFPLRTQSHLHWPEARPARPAPLAQVTLKPGDVLYLPGGAPHLADTVSDRSLHLTLGLRTWTSHDVVSELLAEALVRCEQMAEFRRPIHPMSAKRPDAAELRRLVRAVADEVAVADASRALAARAART